MFLGSWAGRVDRAVTRPHLTNNAAIAAILQFLDAPEANPGPRSTGPALKRKKELLEENREFLAKLVTSLHLSQVKQPNLKHRSLGGGIK